MAIEIVSFPINSMVIFHSYVKLPEGKVQTVRTLILTHSPDTAIFQTSKAEEQDSCFGSRQGVNVWVRILVGAASKSTA